MKRISMLAWEATECALHPAGSDLQRSNAHREAATLHQSAADSMAGQRLFDRASLHSRQADYHREQAEMLRGKSLSLKGIRQAAFLGMLPDTTKGRGVAYSSLAQAQDILAVNRAAGTEVPVRNKDTGGHPYYQWTANDYLLRLEYKAGGWYAILFGPDNNRTVLGWTHPPKLAHEFMKQLLELAGEQ